jgi:hypothetical protein
MQALETSAADIGDVINVITSIAEQTDLLALNATIEAARVGEAGKGFAVVANEVKALAAQTSTATDEIGTRVDAIQRETLAAVQAITEINELIESVNSASTTIAGAVEEQSATTAEVAKNLLAMSDGATTISASIVSVATAADAVKVGAGRTRTSAAHLSDLAGELTHALSGFTLDDGLDDGSRGVIESTAAPVSAAVSGAVSAPAVSSVTPGAVSSVSPVAVSSVSPVATGRAPVEDRAADTPEVDRSPARPTNAATRSDAKAMVGRLEELDDDLLDAGWR